MPKITIAGWQLPAILLDAGIVALAILVALAAHWIVVKLLTRLTRASSSRSDDLFVARAIRPLRWIFIALALAFVRRSLALSVGVDAMWAQAAGLIVPALAGWLAINEIRALGAAIELRADISAEDNLRARRQRTRAGILIKIAVFLVGFLTVCLMLFSIPSVRTVGVTLMASAGLAALAVGAAAQPLLKNLIAGIQMAFTEPIRIDDVVIVDGEWGRIEEIRLTYVVVKIWDERRLVVPVSRFLEDSFQNWTRSTAQILGSIFWWLDPSADIDRLRAKYEELVRANKRWDGRAFVFQVTDTKPDAIEVRGLVTARDAGTAFDLRCDLREALLAYIRTEMPEALPRGRRELGAIGWTTGAAIPGASPAAAC